LIHLIGWFHINMRLNVAGRRLAQNSCDAFDFPLSGAADTAL